jgi:ribose/xylose/arabinose/galactoside ABC-type transport system permease subunit
LRLRLATVSTELQLLLGLAVLYAIFAILYPSTFATATNAQNMARQGAILLVVAIGQMFVLVIGGFDISVGANMGFVGTVAALGMTQHGGLVQGLLLGVVAGAAVGLVNGVLIAGLSLSPFIVTLAMLTFLQGLANQLSSGASVFGLPTSFRWWGAADWGPIPSSLGIAAVVFVLAWFVLARLRIGLYIYAIGGSRDTCRLAGISVVRYEVLTYTVCGLLAGVAGIMLASRVSVGQASLGSGYELLSIATAVIGGAAIGGGVGRLSGVILGVALLTVLNTGMDIAGIGEFIQQMVTGAVLVAAVIIAQIRGVDLRGLAWPRRRPPSGSPSQSAPTEVHEENRAPNPPRER